MPIVFAPASSLPKTTDPDASTSGVTAASRALVGAGPMGTRSGGAGSAVSAEQERAPIDATAAQATGKRIEKEDRPERMRRCSSGAARVRLVLRGQRADGVSNRAGPHVPTYCQRR